jgi:hypothetical protein
MSNVASDSDAPNPAFSQFVSVRRFYPHPVTWVCTTCRLSEKTCTQPKCVRCHALMDEAK